MKHWTKLSILISVFSCWMIYDRNLLAELNATDAKAFLGLLAQVSATMLGFLLAALAILASITGHRLVRNMQKTGHFRVLLQRFFFNTVAYGTATGVALIAYLMNSHVITGTLAAILFFIFACLLLVDVGWRFWLVLSHLSPENT